MSDTPQREMTLDEWVGRLPPFHRAAKELAALRAVSERSEDQSPSPSSLPAPAGLPTPYTREELDALEAYRPDRRTPNIEHVISRLVATARLAVEAQQDRELLNELAWVASVRVIASDIRGTTAHVTFADGDTVVSPTLREAVYRHLLAARSERPTGGTE